jgi:hypothetical protein
MFLRGESLEGNSTDLLEPQTAEAIPQRLFHELVVIKDRGSFDLEAQKTSSGTFSVSDPPAQVGKAIYMANCQQCHKADLTGLCPRYPP